MYLSNRDIREAISAGSLIFDPAPEKIDESSIDLHLDSAEEARVWDIEHFMRDQSIQGIARPELRIARYQYSQFAIKYLKPPPDYREDSPLLVQRRMNQCIIKPGGFLLWQTKEIVGTPVVDPQFVCFVDGKSTRARSGIVVHLTAPTIHAGWSGKITLEIANLGPFDLVLEEDDVIAQLTVAIISSSPDKLLANPSVTLGQTSVTGGSEQERADG